MFSLRIQGFCGAVHLRSQLGPSFVPGRTQIDLSGLRYAEPITLVAIAALAEAALADGQQVLCVPPDDPGVAGYLAHMGLDEALSRIGVHLSLPPVTGRTLRDTLTEITWFDSATRIEQLAIMVHGALERIDLDAANALFSGIMESGANVIEHSGRRGGFLVAQLIRKRTQLQFAVSDSGVGMLQTLRGVGAETHAQALHLALQRGISENPQRGSGIGLYDMNDEILRLGGALQIISGNAVLWSQPERQRVTVWPTEGPGTCLQGLIPLRRREKPQATPIPGIIRDGMTTGVCREAQRCRHAEAV
ncbi:MAG TPA: ATP-binding protein [Nocardioidaceae bacterium]|nr:ATP-binding protein [Nocardioidaceae bacterium]